MIAQGKVIVLSNNTFPQHDAMSQFKIKINFLISEIYILMFREIFSLEMIVHNQKLLNKLLLL